MATGIIPLDVKDNFSGLVCYYGRETATSAASWSNTVSGYSHDFLSYSSGVFTVLKPFTATAQIYGKGSYYEGSGGAGRSISYTLSKTSSGTTTTILSGSVTSDRTGMKSGTASFVIGDTFTLSLSIRGNGTCGTQCGFFMYITT